MVLLCLRVIQGAQLASQDEGEMNVHVSNHMRELGCQLLTKIALKHCMLRMELTFQALS